MKKIMIKIAIILAIVLSVDLKADEHLFTLPVVGNDIEVEHAWYYEGGGLHRAIDYTRSTPGAIEGQDILAAYGGLVIVSTDNHVDYGTYVKIDHGAGFETLYAHMIYESAMVNVGDYVYQGQPIGQVGSTGNSTGPHLHFELIYDNEKIDPYGWYDYASTPNTYPNCNPDEYYWTSNPPVGPPNVSTERQLPDDLLVHVIGTPDYYWIQESLMCGFSCEYPFYTWGLEWDDAVEIANDEFNDFSLGSNVEVMLGAGVADDNFQRWVFDYAVDTSPTIVKRKVNNWQQLAYAVDIWIPVSNSFMAQFNEGSELLTTDDYPYGAVLINSGQRYVLVKGNEYGMGNQKVKLPLFSDDVYNLNYYHYNFNISVASSVLDNYPTVTSAQMLIRDGKLIKGSDNKIYYLENGQKRHIVTDLSFNYYGFDYANVQTVSDEDVAVFPAGEDIFFSPSGGTSVYNGGELEDGGFDSGTEAYWMFFDWQEVADFEVTSDNSVSGFYKSEVNVYQASNYYDVEIKQLVDVESDGLYHCSFYAKSDNPMMIKSNLGRDTDPWENYGLWQEIETQNNWQKYQYIFTCFETDPLARLSFQVGEIPGHLYLDQVIFEKIENIAPPSGNLIANGDFELGHYAPWNMGDINGFARYYTDSFETYNGEYSMFIDPNQSGEHFEVQLEQLVDVQLEETYYVSFYAKAEEDRSLFLELYHNGPPWTNYGLWEEIQIGTGWEFYEIEFVAGNSGTDRFTMHFGHEDVGLWIDDIQISDLNSIEDFVNLDQPYCFLQNYPNPFKSETAISFQLLVDAQVNVSIYNIKGQEIRTLINSQLSSGEHSIIWNGRNGKDQLVSNGVYFYQIKSGKNVKIRKMIFLR